MVSEQDMKDRTKQFALRIMKLVDSMPKTVAGKAIANQLIRSGMSVGANYRAACRGRSVAEFASKIGIVVEEADECCFWMELIIEGNLLPKEKVVSLLKEANELTAIFVSSIRTVQNNHKSQFKNLKSGI